MTYGAVIFFFFFQAEDGIRDWSVTGVQTCALPISRKAAGDSATSKSVTVISPPSQTGKVNVGRGRKGNRARRARTAGLYTRSEERRVGKECRSRGSADDEKKKEDVHTMDTERVNTV